MSGSSINNRFFSQSTIEALSKKVDKNQDKNVLISELKSLDKNKNGNLDTKELNSIGITNTEDIKEIQSEFKNHKSDPNKVFFSSNKLNLNNLSEKQNIKYQNINNLLKDSPKLLSQFNELIRKYNSPNSIDKVLDRTIEKFSKVKNPKNIEFSKNEWEGHCFGLDDANKIIKLTNDKIKYIPDKMSFRKEPYNKISSNIKLLGNRHYSGIGAFRNLAMGNVEHIANYAERDKIGNCLENACLSASIAKDFKGINNIEIYGMNISIGHAFVVINRDKNSTLENMSTWGKDAIVIDSWSGISFKAEDFPSDIEGKKHPKFPSGGVYLELYQNEF